MTTPIHPAGLAEEELLSQCETIRQRRSGPGGQHRNKVETAIRLQHKPTGVTAQASERRSQKENLQQALQRLRVELALDVRNPTSTEPFQPGSLWITRVRKGKLAVNPDHADFGPLLAEALDCLAAHGWDHHPAAEILGISRSQLIKFLKLEPRALQRLNQERQSRGEGPLS